MRRNHGDQLPPLTTIDFEIGIQSHHRQLGVNLGKPHETRIRQRHRHVIKALHQPGYRSRFIFWMKREIENTIREHCAQTTKMTRKVSQKKPRLADDSFTGNKRSVVLLELLRSPCVVLLVCGQISHERPGIENKAPICGHSRQDVLDSTPDPLRRQHQLPDIFSAVHAAMVAPSCYERFLFQPSVS